jgi:glucose dehydrogenase
MIVGGRLGESLPTSPGDIRAFDVRTGALKWSFHTIPHPGEFGYDTWPKEAWQYSGAANNWPGMALDEARGIVYVPTGSATYDFYGADRIGQDLFANCLLALDARTGKRLWHFQTVHHDLWDLDNVSAPQLVTVQHNGRKVDAVAHAGKTGSCTSSIASLANRSGRSKSGRCRRAMCPASRPGRRSRSRPGRRRLRSRRSPWMTSIPGWHRRPRRTKR